MKRVERKIETTEKKRIKTKADKINKRDVRIKVLKIALLIVALALIVIYFLLDLFYSSGGFTVKLDQEWARRAGIIMYEHPETREIRSILNAEVPDVMDNISYHWIEPDIGNEVLGGSHNGDNYIAYTFYIENEGVETHYWYSIFIEAMVLNVDDALRVMVIHNEESTIYAKMGRSGMPEPVYFTDMETVPFYNDQIIMMEQRQRMQRGDIDKFTVVMWLEGDDLECIDDIIGGEMKLRMEITGERIIN